MTKLYVICGHGAGDSGACGNGYQEAERVRTLGNLIKQLGGNQVMLGDVNRNFYKDNGISNLGIPKDCQIIELHMDSSDNTSARGAHVIIDVKSSVDQFDTTLAKYLSGLLPGRSNTIVKRSDLANPARAFASGYSYRLVECGFISNAGDVAIFNSNIDNIAKGILTCFGIGSDAPTPAPQPEQPKPSENLKYGVGTLVCVQKLARSADGTAGVVPSHYEGTITKVYPGNPYPYLLDGGAGFVNDSIIDLDPHTPGVITTSPKGADQIIYPGSKVTLPGVFKVTHVDAKNNKIGSTTLTGVVTKGYHWVDAAPCNEVNDGGAMTGDQIFRVGELFVIPGTFTALAVDIATDAVKLHIGNSDVWVYASKCFEVSDN